MTCWPVASSHLPVSVRQDFDVGIVGQHFSDAFHAGYIGRVSGEAFDLDDVALAAQFLSQPLR